MNIRKMKSEDYEKTYALWLSCPGMGMNSLDDSRAGTTKFLERNPDTCFVAEERNEILGVILVGSDGRRGYIYHAAVHPEHQKCGIGRKLVETSLKALDEQGIAKVSLVAFKRNAEGNKFWEKMGFVARPDLLYRSYALRESVRTET